MLASLFKFARWLSGEQVEDTQPSVDLTRCPYQLFDDWQPIKHRPYHSNFFQEWQSYSKYKSILKEQSLSEDEEPSEESIPEDDESSHESVSEDEEPSEESGSEEESDLKTPSTPPHRPSSSDDSIESHPVVFYPKSTNVGLTADQVATNVTNTLYNALQEREFYNGWVYIFRSPRHPGMFKVGYSHWKSFRLQEHRKCYPDLIEVAAAIMPNANRIEQIILAEFAGLEHYMKDGCEACDKAHEEWLEIDLETLLKTFEKWTDFALQEPYNKSGGLKRDTYTFIGYVEEPGYAQSLGHANSIEKVRKICTTFSLVPYLFPIGPSTYNQVSKCTDPGYRVC